VDVVLTSRAAGVPVKQATLSDTDRRGNKFKPTDWDSSGAGGKWDARTLATLSGEPRPGKRGISPGEVQNSRGICRGDNRELRNPTFSACPTQLRLKPPHPN